MTIQAEVADIVMKQYGNGIPEMPVATTTYSGTALSAFKVAEATARAAVEAHKKGWKSFDECVPAELQEAAMAEMEAAAAATCEPWCADPGHGSIRDSYPESTIRHYRYWDEITQDEPNGYFQVVVEREVEVASQDRRDALIRLFTGEHDWLTSATARALAKQLFEAADLLDSVPRGNAA